MNYIRKFKKKIFLLPLAILFFNSLKSTIEFYDTTFGLDATGIVQNVFGKSSRIKDIALFQDGKIAAVGTVTLNNTQYLFVAKYNSDGTMCSTFGTNGLVTTLIGTNPVANGVAVDLNNNIYVAGTTQVSGVNNIFVIKYLANGSFDLNFAVGGKVTKLVGTAVDGNSITLDANGKVLVGGTATVSGKLNLTVYRLNPNGNADSTFGTNGVKTLVAGSGYTANAIKIDTNSKIVLGGSQIVSGGSNFLVARLKIDGNVDTTFGTNGVTTTAISGATTSVVKSLAFDTNGKLLAGGYSGSSTSSNFTLARYNTNGTLDTSFGTSVNGIQITNFGSNAQITSILMKNDGKIAAAGFVDNLIARARYLTNGSLDLTFGNGGTLTTALSDSAQANALVMQADARTVAGGFSTDSTTNNQTCQLIRYNNNNTDFINITSIANGSSVNTKIPNVNGSSSIANAQVQVLVDNVLLKTINTDANGNWNAGITNILTAGTHYIQVNLISNSANIVAEKIKFTVSDYFAEDSVFAYSSASQTGVASLYTSIPFNNLLRLGTWSYNNNVFTCNKSGTYVIEYTASAGITGTVPENVSSIDSAVSISLNGIEYLGSESNAGLDLNANFNRSLTRSFTKDLNQGDTISFKLALNIISDGPATGFNAGLFVDQNAFGTQPAYSLSITRIG